MAGQGKSRWDTSDLQEQIGERLNAGGGVVVAVCVGGLFVFGLILGLR